MSTRRYPRKIQQSIAAVAELEAQIGAEGGAGQPGAMLQADAATGPAFVDTTDAQAPATADGSVAPAASV
ncbi:MAG: hypothetical protein ACREVL_08430, partial [Solimonas sp.]